MVTYTSCNTLFFHFHKTTDGFLKKKDYTEIKVSKKLITMIYKQ